MEIGMTTTEPELGPDDKVGFLIFRETFLALLDYRGALVCRQFGEVVGERFLDASEAAETQIPFTVAEFDGATRDIFYLAAFLERVSAEPEMSELTRTERHLAKLAEGAARDLKTIAARMRHALERATRADHDE